MNNFKLQHQTIIRCLEEYDFSIEMWLHSPETVLKEILTRIPEEFRDPVAIENYLKYIFMRRINELTQWLPSPEPLLFGDTIHLSFDGREYKAIVRCGRRKLQVILDDINLPLVRTLTLPGASEALFADSHEEGCTTYGLLCAKQIILGLVLEKHYIRKANT